MIEYILLFLLCVITYFLGVASSNKSIVNFSLGILMCYFILLTTFREGIGADYFSYLEIYERASFNTIFDRDNIIEIGYLFINSLSKMLGGGLQLVSFISVVLVLLNYYRASLNFKVSPYFSIPIYICLFAISHNFNIVRHGIATSFIIYAFSTLEKDRKIWKFLISVIIAGLFHKVAYVVLLLFFIKYVRFSILSVSILFIGSFVLSKVIFEYSNIFEGLDIYSKILYYQNDYGGGVDIEDSTKGVLTIGTLFNIIIVFFVLFLWKKRKEKEEIPIKLFIVGVSFMILFRYSPIFSERLAGLFYPALVFIIPKIYQRINIKPKIIILILILMYMGSYYSKAIFNSKDNFTYQYLPYKSSLKLY